MVLVVLGLLGTVYTAVLDPSLTEWRLITSEYEKVMFPLREYILEVKAFLPEEYDTNPPYGELIRTDKSTSMMAHLYAGSYKVEDRVGELVWNTIKYDAGRDIAIDECDARYEAYRSWPAGGAEEQIWAWNFFPNHVELTCNDEMQYEQHFDEGEEHFKKTGLPEKCRKLGDADVDRIIFKFMKGEYIRGRPKPAVATTAAGEIKTTTVTKPDLPPTRAPTPEPEDPGEQGAGVKWPTCECWTEECNYCSNMECTVKHDLINSDFGVTVTSKVGWKKLNSIMLYNAADESIGSFQWSAGGIYLSGCIRCQSTPAIKALKGGGVTWTFGMNIDENGFVAVTISVGGEVLWEQKLIGECNDIYKDVGSFAFFDTTCENTFLYNPDVMVAGARITPDCAGACLLE